MTTGTVHFYLTGFVNRQNMRYWVKENRRELVEKPLYYPCVTVYRAIGSFDIIGPYFFEDEDSKKVTVNAERYVKMF